MTSSPSEFAVQTTSFRPPASSRAGRAGRIAWAALFALTLSFAGVAAADSVTEARTIGTFKTVRLVGSADPRADAGRRAVAVGRRREGRGQVPARRDARRRTRPLVRTELQWELVGFREEEPPVPALHQVAGPHLHVGAAATSARTRSPFRATSRSPSRGRATSSSARWLRASSWSASAARATSPCPAACWEQNVRIAGSGDYRSGALQSASATISIGGSGDATLWARDSLAIKIAGSGDVKYYGRPTTLSKSVAGSGSVTALGEKP